MNSKKLKEVGEYIVNTPELAVLKIPVEMFPYFIMGYEFFEKYSLEEEIGKALDETCCNCNTNKRSHGKGAWVCNPCLERKGLIKK